MVYVNYGIIKNHPASAVKEIYEGYLKKDRDGITKSKKVKECADGVLMFKEQDRLQVNQPLELRVI